MALCNFHQVRLERAFGLPEIGRLEDRIHHLIRVYGRNPYGAAQFMLSGGFRACLPCVGGEWILDFAVYFARVGSPFVVS